MALDISEPESLAPILAGPILRRLTPRRLVIWLASSEPLDLRLCLYDRGSQTPFLTREFQGQQLQHLRIGERAFVQLIDLRPEQPLPVDRILEYDLFQLGAQGERGLRELLPGVLYEGEQRPSLVIRSRLDDLVHGSCRKPHHPGPDALPRLDRLIEATRADPAGRPAMLIMSGDQIYADDVAGPMLVAIHQVIRLLGLYPEQWRGATVADSEALLSSPYCYYQREELLPRTHSNQMLRDRFFGGAKKPIFTTASAHNHLITLAEVEAMYLLTWSPVLWPLVWDAVEGKIDVNGRPMYQPPGATLSARQATRYAEELAALIGFRQGMDAVQRAFAHLPVYMIFDDHDITDDWNLTRGWEETAYGHPFSRRIIGNALISYWLFQGWGNDPDRFDIALLDSVRRFFAQPVSEHQDALIERLLDFECWHYSVPTQPKLVVLDTRTDRWRSETSLARPSGLMDWEGLSELQQMLMHEDAVVMVSPAPIFGVKLIETLQRLFTFFGYALMVDAENWMAHPGSANVILNIFRHRRTPRHFVILSGDVHYSFVYDVKIRFRDNSPEIWQITASGFKNEFPHSLLRWLDLLNRWLFGTRSPLNWFTKRRRMKIRARRPNASRRWRLFNRSALGRVQIDASGVPVAISLLTADGDQIHFPEPP